jgi:uncharacterized protein YyaL (SSP411 family)
MPLEALAAVGLASNVLQFISFAAEIVTKSKEISSSTSGFTVEAVHSGRLTERSKCLCDGLSTNTSTSDSGIGKLSRNYANVAEELLQAFAKAQLKDPKTKWNSLRAALKAVWGSDRIEKLALRLREYREQLILEILLVHE